jgi:methylated-DNA-[protein]-cysteine S-methyltransferase
MEHVFAFATPFGSAAVAWTGGGGGPRLHRIYLPGEAGVTPTEGGRTPAEPAMAELVQALQRYLAGEEIDFSPYVPDLSGMGFARRALFACCQIPRGRVSTYGALAARLQAPGAARAVGTAMARNPFPLVVPCHRVVRAGGDPGCFGGGAPMKRALLAMEGVRFDGRGRVLAACIVA